MAQDLFALIERLIAAHRPRVRRGSDMGEPCYLIETAVVDHLAAPERVGLFAAALRVRGRYLVVLR